MPVIVPPEGNKHSAIAIVGQSPGAEEERLGRPFVGQSGKLLDSSLLSCGINRASCYITNVVKVRPPRNDFDSVYWRGSKPTEALIAARDELLNELSTLPNLNVAVALGKDALWALTGKTQIGKWRGSVIPLTLPSGRQIKVISTYHPAACLRQWSLLAVVKIDLLKVVREMHTNTITRLPRNCIVCTSPEQLSDYILNQSSDRVAFDIETSCNTIICVGMAFSKTEAIVIPTTIEYWKHPSTLHSILNIINSVLSSSDIVKIGQNLTFDVQYLLKLFAIKVSKPWFDTAVAQHVCYSELPKGLDFLASVYTDVMYYKDDLKVWNADKSNSDTLYNYNALDCMVTFEVAEKLEREMAELGTKHTFDYLMELLEPSTYMSLRGIKVDTAKLKSVKDELELRVSAIKSELESLGINPRSPKQLAEYAYSTRKFKPIISRKTGKPTVDGKALKKLSEKDKCFSLILELRNTEKLISTYLTKPLLDGRWMFSLNVFGTETLRLSSSESPFGYGGNVQNIPKHLRDMFIADDGMTMIEVDLKGAEAMVMAYLTGDERMIRVFSEGGNIHAFVASQLYDTTVEKVIEDKKFHEANGTSNSSMYQRAKRVVHAANYGASYLVVEETLGVDAKTAKRLLDKYYSSFPSVVRYREHIVNTIRATRRLTTPLGTSRIFLDRFGNELMREALAFVPQETVTHVINLAIIRLYNTVKYADLLAQVHDAMLFQVPDDKVDEVLRLLPGIMRTDITINGHTFYIPWEVKVGKSWGDMKEVKA